MPFDSTKTYRLCGMCQTWNTRPCGEQCGWSPDDPPFIETSAAVRSSSLSAPTRTAGERTVTVKDGIYHSEPPSVTIHGSAIAGVIDGLGGDSGAIRIDITDHEIMDMAISGQAYSLDGRFNFKNRSPLLDAAWAVRSSSLESTQQEQ